MISILIPTRGRRRGLERAVRSALQTADDPNCLQFVAYVDQDDALTYFNFNEEFNLEVQFIIGPRIVLSNCWNKCAVKAVGDIFQQSNDDVRYQTKGWDSLVYEEFEKCPDKILLVHGSDGSSRPSGGQGKFGVHSFVSRRWVETLGYFTPAFFSSDFGDSWIGEVADCISRRRYLPFVIEHLHPIFGKGEEDATYLQRLVRHSNDNVEQLYRDLAPLREVDIEKLKAAIANPAAPRREQYVRRQDKQKMDTFNVNAAVKKSILAAAVGCSASAIRRLS